MNSKELYEIYCKYSSIVTDSRKITPDSIFVALKGDTFNGDDYAEDALKKGAAYAVVSNESNIVSKKVIKVKNTLKTLQNLATLHRKERKFKILAITGSNGKTTTKELCKAILSRKFKVGATTGNLNNHIGVPLTILSFSQDINFGIVEMGANHPGEIMDLATIALPDYGLITNIGKAHLEGFGTIEGVAKAKNELFELLQQNNKTLFINSKNDYLRELIPESYKNKLLYNNNDFHYEILKSDPYLVLNVYLIDKILELQTGLVGKYNAENILAASVVGHYFSIPEKEIKDAVESYIPDNNRSQLIVSGDNKIVMDAYNANPSSMNFAIESFAEMKGEKKVCILGQMLELGLSSVEEHKKIIEKLRFCSFNTVILVGEEFKSSLTNTDFIFYNNVEELIEYFKKAPLASSLILVKGSRGNRLEKLIPYL